MLKQVQHDGPRPFDRTPADAYFPRMTRKIDIETLCAHKGLRITEQRRTIARVLGDSEDHPDVETLHARASAIDANISIATVYRTVRLFEEAGILERHEFGDGRSRYEAASETHHDHLIDVETGNVIEFADDELEALQKRIAEKLGFRLVDHRMELYGVSRDRDR
jgi:Fur family ferric uptake transcriptional regulator